MENYINLLIINNDKKTQGGLKEVLSDETTNILFSESYENCIETIIKKEIGIVIIDIDQNTTSIEELFKAIKSNSIKHFRNQKQYRPITNFFFSHINLIY